MVTYSSSLENGLRSSALSRIYETEILQASNVSNYGDYNEPDDIGLDISCNLSSVNVVNVMGNGKEGGFERIIKNAVDMLTFIVDDTDIQNAPAINKANREMRSIGLGAMGLHTYLATHGIHYESEEAKDFANTFFMMMNYYSLQRSMELAKKREPFKHFKGSTYDTGEYFDMYLEKSFAPESDKVDSLFKGIDVPSKKDWEKLKKKVQKHGVFHSYRQSIPPNGSSSYILSVSSGAMPIMERIEERTYGNSKTYYPMGGLDRENWDYFKEAYDMDMFRVIELIATIQQHIDQGISFTLFVNDNVTTRDINKLDMYAHYMGIKTIYYVRTREVSIDECLACTV